MNESDHITITPAGEQALGARYTVTLTEAEKSVLQMLVEDELDAIAAGDVGYEQPQAARQGYARLLEKLA